MATQTLMDRVKFIMYGLGPKLMDKVTKTMFGYDSQHTATGKIPDRIDLAPKIDDSQALMREHVSFTFGRFSVPHSGHTKIMDRLLEEAGTGPHYVFASQTQDSDKNPLDYDTKCAFMEAYWPDMNIFEGYQVKTLFDAIAYLEEQEFKNATLVVGQDRLLEFTKLLERYSNDYNMTIGVVGVERSDDDVSATRMREAVLNEDYETFQSLACENDKVTEHMYDVLSEATYKDARRCTGKTINAICDHHGVEGLASNDKAPIEGLGVLETLKKKGLKVTGHHDQSYRGKSVHDFVQGNPTGAHYISTAGHAMAVVNGKLHDASGKGADKRRKIQSHFAVVKNGLMEQVQEIMNRVPMVDGGLEDTETIGVDKALKTPKNAKNIKRRATMKRFKQIKDET